MSQTRPPAPFPTPPAPPPPARRRNPFTSKLAIGVYGALAALGVVAVIISGDSGTETPAPAPTVTVSAPTEPAPATTKAAAPTTEAEPAQDPRCQPVSKTAGQRILDGGNDTKLTFVEGATIASDEHNYFVAIRFTTQGDPDPMVGVWQTLSLDGGPIASVDGFAKRYTVWPDSGNAGAAIVDDVKGCLK